MIIYKNSYSLKTDFYFVKKTQQYTFQRWKSALFDFMQSNHDTILSYLKRCICCWYWDRVLIRRTLPPYKMFGTNIRPSCDFLTTVKSSRPHAPANPTLTCFLWFRFGLGNGIQKTPFMCSYLNIYSMLPKVLQHIKKSLYNQPKPYFFKKLL